MKSLASELAICVKSKFTGRLDISTYKGNYKLYFGLGSLAWATGGLHPNRRWRRTLRQICPDIDQGKIKIRQTDEMDNWEYSALVILLQRGMINTKQLLEIANSYATEVLFDLIQISVSHESIASLDLELAGRNEKLSSLQSQVNVNQNSLKITPYLGIRPAGNHALPRTLNLALGITIADVQQDWNSWVRVIGNEAINISPNHVPIIKRPETLARKITPKAYKNLSILANGNYTIRDIAEVLQKKPWEIMNLFMPHIRHGDMGLIELPDLDNVISGATSKAADRAAETSILFKESPGTPRDDDGNSSICKFIPKPLVACIDDSQQHCKTLGTALRDLGCEFMPIVNEVEALPQLITNIPSIIFLDLLMPVINGYELCIQIRRVSRLENVPVIILTGKSGIVDRVRAKIVGATDFVTKPVNPEQLQEILQRYDVIAQG